MLHSTKLYGITDSSQDLIVNDSRAVFGFLYAVLWLKDDLADGVGAVLSTQAPGNVKTLLTLTAANTDNAFYYPRDLVHDAAGTALTGTSGGDRALPVIDGTLRLVVAQGGATNAGGCIVYWCD